MTRGVGLVLILLSMSVNAFGWWGDGHHLLTKAAVTSLPESMPAFFRSGHATIAHCALDPDVVRNRDVVQLKETEGPQHYLDIEFLKGHPLPDTRKEYTALCEKLGVKPEKAGFLPYVVIEQTQRLAVAFAEHRKWKDNPHIQSKCLVHAGLLAHYAQDLLQPLHLTIHFDGRARKDDSSPHSGIHVKIDALVKHLDLNPDTLASMLKPTPLSDLPSAVLTQASKSNGDVDTVYQIEGLLPKSAGDALHPRVKSLTTRWSKDAARLTACLYLTAWQLSSRIKLDDWLDREKLDGENPR